MNLQHLKRIRVAVSVIFFILTTLLFVDFAGIVPSSWTNNILFLQFIPSLMKFVITFSIAGTGFLIILLLTLLFGRVYCSSICPLGTLQDGVSLVARKLRRKKYRYLRKTFSGVRYGLLVLTAVLALGGTLLVLNLLDPYSSFGRIATNFIRPVVLTLNNALAFGLESIHLYVVYPVPIKTINITSLFVALLVLGTVLWMSYNHGRLYCNTLCPLGALLGWMSRFSMLRITINKNECIGCNLCEHVCKGGCIDKKAKTLDLTRCVSCYNCFTVCPKEGLVFRNALAAQHQADVSEPDLKRREALYNSWLLVAAIVGGTTPSSKKIISKKDSTIVVARQTPVAPPGSGNIAQFTDTCTACHLCISACPSQVLSSSFLEYGLAGMMQPRMDYAAGFCNYECTTCTEICPSGALLPVVQEQKKLTQCGTAKFVKDNCIVYTESTECGACSEHCPTKAVRMVPYKKLLAPEVNEEYCIGCGACEYACPTKPYKAIYVEGKSVHGVAKKPEVKKIDVTVPEEFPF